MLSNGVFLHQHPKRVSRIALIQALLLAVGLLANASPSAIAYPIEVTTMETTPPVAPLLGGSFLDLRPTAVAAIATNTYSCSGVLVGPREVLTAAHCVDPSTPVTAYQVFVGSHVHSVSQAFYDSGFDQNAPVSREITRFDLGMLILDSNVTTVSPIPILANLPLTNNMRVYFYGYGTNETSGATNSILDQGKGARIVINSVVDGTFESDTDIANGASICAGDSGGPALRVLGSHSSVVGLASSGLNSESFGYCVLQGNGGSTLVDLQSPYAADFLANFPEVEYLPGPAALIVASVSAVNSTLRSAIKSGGKKALRQKIGSSRKTLSALRLNADATRLSLIDQAISILSHPSPSNPAKTARRVLSILQTLIRLGLS